MEQKSIHPQRLGSPRPLSTDLQGKPDDAGDIRVIDSDRTTTVTFQLPEDPTARLLMEWWLGTAYEDCLASVPKIKEYGASGESHDDGSSDLRVIGTNLAELIGWKNSDDAVCQEMGAWFYLQGKVARLINDYRCRRHGKADSWHDATVYTMMARRLQSKKNWP